VKANPYQHCRECNSLRFIKYLSQELIRNIVCTFETMGDKRKIEANWKLSLIAISKYYFFIMHINIVSLVEIITISQQKLKSN